MPDGKELYDYIKPNLYSLLSAPSSENSSRLGKRLWVKNKIPGTKLILASAKNKQNYSEEGAILIDDRADTIREWDSTRRNWYTTYISSKHNTTIKKIRFIKWQNTNSRCTFRCKEKKKRHTR
jgi:hypothetical protein